MGFLPFLTWRLVEDDQKALDFSCLPKVFPRFGFQELEVGSLEQATRIVTQAFFFSLYENKITYFYSFFFFFHLNRGHFPPCHFDGCRTEPNSVLQKFTATQEPECGCI